MQKSINTYLGYIDPVLSSDTSATETRSSFPTMNDHTTLLTSIVDTNEDEEPSEQTVVMQIPNKSKFHLFFECFISIICAFYVAFEILAIIYYFTGILQKPTGVSKITNVIHSAINFLLTILTIVLLYKLSGLKKLPVNERLINKSFFIILCLIWFVTVINYTMQSIKMIVDDKKHQESINILPPVSSGCLSFINIFLVYKLINYEINFDPRYLSNSFYFLLKYTVFITFCSMLIHGIFKIIEGLMMSYNFKLKEPHFPNITQPVYYKIFKYTYPLPFVYYFVSLFIFYEAIEQIKNRFIYQSVQMDEIEMNKKVNLFITHDCVTGIGILSLILMLLGFIGSLLYIYGKDQCKIYLFGTSIFSGVVSTIASGVLFKVMSSVENYRDRELYKSYQFINSILLSGHILFCLNYVVLLIRENNSKSSEIIHFCILCIQAILQSTIIHYMLTIDYKVRVDKNIVMKMFFCILLLVGANFGFSISNWIMSFGRFEEANENKDLAYYMIQVICTPCNSVYRLLCAIAFLHFLIKLKSK